MTRWAVLDILLAAGLYLRLTRFVVTDDLGGWMIRHPLHRVLFRADPHETYVYSTVDIYQGQVLLRPPWQEKLNALVHCPWCIGFWIAGAVLLSLAAVGGPGDAPDWWRWVAGWWTLNYVGAHLGARLGDTDGDAE